MHYQTVLIHEIYITFTAIELHSHGDVAFPSYRSKADYTCYDRWINLMKNNTVHIRISIKYLHEKMVVQLIEGLLVYLV